MQHLLFSKHGVYYAIQRVQVWPVWPDYVKQAIVVESITSVLFETMVPADFRRTVKNYLSVAPYKWSLDLTQLFW